MIITNLNYCTVNEEATIEKCILNLEKSSHQIIFIVDKKNRLLGSLTDGDIRRAILNKFTLKDKINFIYNKNPIKCIKPTSYLESEKIMSANQINHLPIVSDKNKLVGFYKLVIKNTYKQKQNFDFIIMAGGKGLRLRPFTIKTPKPMLKINGEPILKIIINRAKEFGIKNYYISINYLGNIIKDYFKRGKKLDVDIKYISENRPLGTLGSVGNIKEKLQNKNVIVVNGDVITEINYESLIKFHEKKNADATMAVYPFEMKNPYGEVVTKDENILEIKEKPISISYVNAGVYVFKKNILSQLKKNKKIDSVEFFNQLRKKNKKIVAFAIHETWKDIGLRKDYLKVKNQK